VAVRLIRFVIVRCHIFVKRLRNSSHPDAWVKQQHNTGRHLVTHVTVTVQSSHNSKEEMYLNNSHRDQNRDPENIISATQIVIAEVQHTQQVCKLVVRHKIKSATCKDDSNNM
jgi:hypothetical protein